jgi:hypothetical protein
MLPIVAGPLAAVAAQLGCTGARIRVGRTRQPAVSAEGGYTAAGPADSRSSDTFGAVSAHACTHTQARQATAVSISGSDTVWGGCYGPRPDRVRRAPTARGEQHFVNA